MHHLQKPKLLIVEDSPAVALSIELLLQRVTRDEYRYVIVATLEDAINALRGGGVAVVLLDRKLPDADGFDGLRRLRREFRAVPVVLISGDFSHEEKLRGLLEGAQACFDKPVEDAEAFQQAICEAILRQRYTEEVSQLDRERADAIRKEFEARIEAIEKEHAKKLKRLRWVTFALVAFNAIKFGVELYFS